MLPLESLAEEVAATPSHDAGMEAHRERWATAVDADTGSMYYYNTATGEASCRPSSRTSSRNDGKASRKTIGKASG